MTGSATDKAKLKAVDDLRAALRDIGGLKPADLLRTASEPIDELDALAAAERLILLENLNALADALDAFGVPAEHQAAFRRLFHGVFNVHSGRRFYAFEGPRGKSATTPSDAIYRRCFIAAAIGALKKSGMSVNDALAYAERRMRACVATDFDCPADGTIDRSKIKNWRDRFGRERRRDANVTEYGRLMEIVERTNSPEGLRRLAETLLDDAIHDADPSRYSA